MFLKKQIFSKLGNSAPALGRITGDFAVNILASVIYTFARQIVVFPLLAARLPEDTYGTLLTVTGLVNVCTALVGNSLNNIRLVQNSQYEERGIQGDFNLLCALGCAGSVVFSAVLWQMFAYDTVTALLLTAYLMVSNLYQYACAFFRLELNFKRIFWCNVLVSLAYTAAAFPFATESLWPMVFLIGEGAGLLYVSLRTPFVHEPCRRTPLFGETAQKAVVFMLSSLVGNLLLYADRMIIYPVLGPESVSYYSTASFFGKSAGIVMTPIAGVLLGYFAQKSFRASRRLFVLVNGISAACLGVFFLGCWLLAPWFTRLLLPTLYEASAPYILLANLGAVVSIAGNMAQPMILKCCSTRWILAIQLVYGGTYLLLAMALLPAYGLTGFCWATILANGVRLLALYALGLWKF